MKLRQPKVRQDVYDIYWQFAAERQKIFELRLSGIAGPWTDDPILANNKFCNVFRATDRVSQYMINNVIYNQDDIVPADKLFQIVAFRTFSNIETWDMVTDILGHSPLIADLESGTFESALGETKLRNGKLYTGAFILCANNAYGRSIKHLNHIELFRDMFVFSNLAGGLLSATSLGQVNNLLHRFPLMGDFMSYQTAIDLNYSPYINFSENDFTKAGPGAIRGIRKVFEDTGDYTPEDIIMWMVDNQQQEFDRLDLEFHGLFGRSLHAIDAQGLFCETDKYCRQALPDLTSNRTKIKARFSPHSQPIVYKFPPKWGIDIA